VPSVPHGTECFGYFGIPIKLDRHSPAYEGSATSDLCELAHQGNWLITVQDENKQACREIRLTHHQSLVTFPWVTLTVQQNLEKLREALLIKVYNHCC
jgi:hypothetical protein